jgi:putative oxidoreductase
MSANVSLGILVIRVVVGLLMLGHGLQKIFGWFGGAGMQKTRAGFEYLGFRPAFVMAWLAGLGEAGSGALLSTGFLFPLGAASLVGVMINAGAVHWRNGPWITKQGFEYTLVLGATAAGLGFTGPGAYSLDAWIGLDLDTMAWGVAALVAGLVAGGATLALRGRIPARSA